MFKLWIFVHWCPLSTVFKAPIYTIRNLEKTVITNLKLVQLQVSILRRNDSISNAFILEKTKIVFMSNHDQMEKKLPAI